MNDQPSAPPGRLLILSGPSGAGKSTIAARLRDAGKVRLSVSHTTRVPRRTENEGEQYFFVGASTFVRMRDADGFLEWARVHGNYYGTSKEWVQSELARGEKVLLEIDCQGAKQVREKIPATSIFILPPSLITLRQRLTERGLDNPGAMQKRLAAAEDEIRQKGDFDYNLVNDDLETATARAAEIIDAL